MNENKFRYSKCPYCRRHGIVAFPKVSRRKAYNLTCIYCQKTFKAKYVLVFCAEVFSLVITGGFSYLIHHFEFNKLYGVEYILFIVLFFLSHYFAPLRKIDNQFIGPSSKRKRNKR